MVRFNILPKDIMIEILIRLPTQSVLKCKLVSKQWRDLIHHPSFSQLHLNYLNHSDAHADAGKLNYIFSTMGIEKQFYYTEYDDENFHETTPFSRQTRIKLDPPFIDNYILSSCDGLICFNARCNKEEFYYEPAYICNPITREYIILPKLEEEHMIDLLFGFGYNSSTNEYKVVRIYNSKREPNVGIIQVYTLGSGNGWRNVGKMNMDIKHLGQCAGAFANEALHWVDQERNIILAFHLTDEKFSELPPPPPCLTRAGVPYLVLGLGVLGDFLSATFYFNAGDCNMWLLKKNKDTDTDLSWSKEFSFDSYIHLPFDFMKSGRLLCCGRGKIVSYDPKASSAEMDVSFGKSISAAIPHKNTLVSLKVLGEKDTKTMESGESTSSSEETESSDKLKKP
ncbi:F-box protein At3g07870-like [Papaver somniferum]|uniref:F-box protein At3g07870-like n=1 Tax=Papaver somniferum TaxID=3469 RepID=UPI000E7018D8|nr:F-box protein At3g07870-like [Papaver somniferum]XP_026415614.1 F-box protein At3g07870-like [Papaver somniferum]